MLAPRDRLTICFAHVAYRFQERFAARETCIRSFEVRDLDQLKARINEADVLVLSGLWRNELAASASKLRFVQSASAGIDQYDQAVFRQHNIRLASAQGVNAKAVAEHAMALILALARKLPEGARNQANKVWRGMLGDFDLREDELGGKTLLIVGLGRIGGRLAKLARAFDMRVIGVRRDPKAGSEDAHGVHGLDELPGLLPFADYVALTCPLTPETEGLIDGAALAAMKPSAALINVARGRCVDEAALIQALHDRSIKAAALDVTTTEPLPATSPLWAMPNVIITPHTAGETCRYEDNVLDIMLDNLERLWRGECKLRNQVV